MQTDESMHTFLQTDSLYSSRQFRSRVEKWRAKKYSSKTDAELVIRVERQLCDRARDNKESIVIRNGRQLSNAEIQQMILRGSLPRLADKFTPGSGGEDSTTQESDSLLTC